MYEYDYLTAALNISYMIFSYGFLPKVEDFLGVLFEVYIYSKLNFYTPFQLFTAGKLIHLSKNYKNISGVILTF